MIPSTFRALRPLILASASPRRRDMLAGLGLDFTIHPAETEPPPSPGEAATDFAVRAALAKARDVANSHPEAVVLAADTVVTLHGRILGKPADEADALSMLESLCGRWHDVITGCAIIDPLHGERTLAPVTRVRFANPPTNALHAYVATGEPMDKAGAYAIQGVGGFLVERIEGSYTNVVGLPLAEVVEVLLELGVVVPKCSD